MSKFRRRVLAHPVLVCVIAIVVLAIGGAAAYAQFISTPSTGTNTFTAAAVFPAVNSLPPSITGTAQQGVQLTVSNDTWSNSPTLTYQWEDCNSSGAGCVDVSSGGTSSTYTPVSSDVGYTLRVVVTATNAGGSPSATSAASAVVLVEVPTDTVPPSIPGTPQQGTQITGSIGTWSYSPTSYSYNWALCESSGGNCTIIGGATSATYTPVSGDVGHTLRFIVSATNAGGTIPVSSSPSAVVLVAAPVNTAAPTVTGTAQQGTQLTATNGSWSYSPTGYAYQWQDCDNSGLNCSNVATGGTSSTYTPSSADIGHTLEVVVTAINGGGSDSTTSAPTAVVLIEAPANTAAPTIIGTAQQGTQLTATNGSWSYSPTGYAYQWQDCDNSGLNCSNVATGGTSSTYTPVSADVGHTLEVTVTATNGGGSSSAASAATAAVLVEAPVNTALPAITGTAQQGVQLTASNGSWNYSPTAYAYQWQDCNSVGVSCSNVATGGTSSSYTPAGSDVGSTLEVTVTATNAGGSTPATSAATALVLIAAPVNSVLPAITGSPQQGVVMTAAHGTWSNSPNYTYQWQDCNSLGASCANVATGGTSMTYTPVASDVADTLEVVVTATNGGGSATATSASTPVLAGAITEFSTGITASSEPWGIAAGPDGNMWFTEFGANKIGKITPGGAVTETSLASGANPNGIAAGPDGNLWFTEYGGNKIGKITPGGTVSLYTIPSTGANAYGIAAGPDGNMWFTEFNTNKIGKITPGGTITEYPTLTAGAGPRGIVAGPDGNMWFAEYNANMIAKITPSGTITEYPLPTAGSEPRAIAAGPDGNMWFTEYGGARIGKITPTGTVTEYSTGSAATAYGITAGPDGNMWFTEYSGTRIGRISTSGVVTTFSSGLTASSSPAGIAAGPDGNLRFTEYTGTQIGRLVIGYPVDTALPAITGGAAQGQTLTATTGAWTGAPTPAYTYQWQDCNLGGYSCVAISGATSSTYTLAAGDVGDTVEVVVTATNSYNTASATSAATATVIIPAPVNTASPSITGSPQQGATLTAANGTWNGSPAPTYTYQWQDCNTGGTSCSNISGATSGTYAPVASDAGQTLVVVVTATNTGGTASATSPATAVAAGAVTEFSTGITASAGPRWIVAGPDGNLWFTEYGANQIAKITPAGVITEYSTGVGAGASPNGIAVGPAGNLWFTEQGANKIGKITPSGTVTLYAGLTSGSQPRTIVAGPDGNMWFTEYGGSRIGKITPSGTVTEYSTGITAGANPDAIAVGPDGNLWFTEYTGNRIGKITTSGTVTEYSTGITTGAGPRGIAAGPDGNMWFTESGGNRIGKITTSGTVTEYSTGISSGASPYEIVAGPDGNLWFAENGSNRIGRISPTTGKITEFSTGITSGANPYGIAVGPDGNLWVTEYGVSQIGRLVIGYPVDTALPAISGTATHGQTLSASAGTWTATATPTYTYQWQDCNAGGYSCVAISGATSSSYLVAANDETHTIRVVVTATSAPGSASASSAATATVN